MPNQMSFFISTVEVCCTFYDFKLSCYHSSYFNFPFLWCIHAEISISIAVPQTMGKKKRTWLPCRWFVYSQLCFYNYAVIDCLMVFQLLGFFAGIHLAILAAYVCRRHPNASINTLLSLFFDIFVHWPWPLPVSLLDPPVPCRGPDGCSLMPIMLPCIPPEFCSSSTTESTFSKIKEELQRGYALSKV